MSFAPSYAKRKARSAAVASFGELRLVDGWSPTSSVSPTRVTCWASAKSCDHSVRPVAPSRTVTKVPVVSVEPGEVNGRYGLVPTSAVKTTSAIPSPVRSPCVQPRSELSAYGLLAWKPVVIRAGNGSVCHGRMFVTCQSA